jgi:hypothetical protein
MSTLHPSTLVSLRGPQRSGPGTAAAGVAAPAGGLGAVRRSFNCAAHDARAKTCRRWADLLRAPARQRQVRPARRGPGLPPATLGSSGCGTRSKPRPRSAALARWAAGPPLADARLALRHHAQAAPQAAAAAEACVDTGSDPSLSDQARSQHSADELLAFVQQHSAALSGPDCAAICNHLAKITDRHKMTVNTWSTTHVGGAAAAARAPWRQLAPGPASRPSGAGPRPARAALHRIAPHRIAPPQALLRAVTRLLEERWAELRGQDYLYTIAAMAKLRFQPRLAWVNAFLGYSRRRLEAAGPGHLTIYLRSLACLHMQPWDIKACTAFGPWVAQHLAVTRAKLRAFTPQELTKVEAGGRCMGGRAAQTAAVLQLQPPGPGPARPPAHPEPPPPPPPPQVICALADLGYRPDDEWLAAYSAAVTTRLYAYDASFLAKTMAAFSQLQFMPGPDFMRKWVARLEGRSMSSPSAPEPH